MNRPEEIDLNWIEIDKNKNQNLYLQLVDEFIKHIQLGNFREGQKIPGTRKFAQLIGLNRLTILKSLHELEILGWIEIKPKKGSYILEKKAAKKIAHHSNRTFSQPFSLKKSILFDLPKSPSLQFNLDDGQIDNRMAEWKIPSKIYSQILKRNKSNWDANFFYKQLTNYLNITYDFGLDKSQILLSHSTEMSLQIVCRVLFHLNDNIAIGEFNHYKINILLQSLGLNLQSVEMDELGLIPESVERLCKTKKIKALIFSPYHQYPIAKNLPEDRLQKLVDLSIKYEFVLIEIGYDFELQYASQNFSPLISKHFGNIFYIGQLGQMLASGFQLSYVIGPSVGLKEMRKVQYIFDKEIDPMLLQLWSSMLYEGEFHKILYKHQRLYKQRRDHFAEILLKHFSGDIDLEIPICGLGFWLKWKKTFNLLKFKQLCEENDLNISLTQLYQNQKVCAMRLGFGSWNEDEQFQIVKILYNNYLKTSI